MRVLLLAPFERGRSQGGSQRATAIAERLEERGAQVKWQTIARRDVSRSGKVRAAACLEPTLSALYRAPNRQDRRWDVALVAHSYLVPTLRPWLSGSPTAVDFHNLEWRHLADGSAKSGSLRDLYARTQVLLMRRLERSILRSADLSLLVSDEERRWASAVAPAAQTLLTRSVVPRSEELVADAVRSARNPEPRHLVYVGTLTFPTNITSLERFLTESWPAMRRAGGNLRLSIAGACGDAVRTRLNAHPGVRALGFVPDLTELLARCQAVLMPFDGQAGTSLRALFFALTGIPSIGTPEAFRGLDFAVGASASSPKEWADAIAAITDGQIDVPAAQDAAWTRQRDPAPWDRLQRELATLATKSNTVTSDG